MAKASVFIWHNLSGEILAVGRPMAAAKCVPVSGDAESVLETEVDEEYIADLSRTHAVDVHRRVLVRPGSPAEAESQQ
jgi:hypothetical protein